MTAVASDPRAQRDWARLRVLVGLVVLLFCVLLAGQAGGADTAAAISNAGLGGVAAVAATACVGHAVACSGRTRWGWTLIGLGALSWSFGQGALIWLEATGRSAEPPSPADVGYAGMVLLTVAGLLVLPSRSQTPASRARSVLDGLMVGISLVLIAWILIVEPLLKAGAESRLLLGITLFYPLGDVVIVTIVLFMLAQQQRRGGGEFGRLALVGAGIVAFAVSDIGYAYLNLVGRYVSGGVSDVGWFAGFALILLAARRPAAGAAGRDKEPDAPESSQPVGVLLPYIAVLAALATSVIWFARTGQPSAFVAYTRSGLILLIVGRQLLTLLENRSLTRNLEGRVADRTAALSASERRFHALVQHSSDVVTVVSPKADVLYQSESVQRVFGHPAHELTGRRLTRLLDAESATRLARALSTLGGRPYATTVLEVTVPHRDGRARQAEMTITNLLDDPSVGGLVLNTRDISERKQLQDQLVHEAHHDALTQLANRALFRERVTQALSGRTPDEDVTVLFLDLDGFKEVNDSLGHLAGDQLLVLVADRLRAAVRDGDVVARFGGDEFAVLVRAPLGQCAEAETVAQRIVDVLGEPFTVDGRTIHVQASIGLAAGRLLAGEGGGAEQLMRNADLSMYKAKQAGGSGYASYHPEMLSGLVERLELEADLRLAVERGELELHYQPTVDLRDRRITGFEALVRWRHPVRGLIPPGDFIPLAESTGLIVALGRWVLAEATRQAVAWGLHERPVLLSVNVSVRQFDRCDLAAVVADVLGETGLPADRLCLEMTESVLMTDTEENLGQLLRLKALGVRLAIDDFGTGYSSLAYLRRFPVDALKIDRSFVESLGSEPGDTALAHSIVQLGSSLGMDTVAEGVEEYAQLAALQEMGCTHAQGYYFSRPLPAESAGRLLHEDVAAHA